MTTQDLLKLASHFEPIIGVVTGVLLGTWLTTWRERKQRRYQFIERQLHDFYSPILWLHAENQFIYENQREISGTANEVWRGSCAELRHTAKAEENLERFSAERGPAFAAITDYDNKQMADQVN